MGILCDDSNRNKMRRKINTNDNYKGPKKDNDRKIERSFNKGNKNKQNINKVSNISNNSNTISTNYAVINKDRNISNINNTNDFAINNNKVSTISENLNSFNSEANEDKNVIYSSDRKIILDQLQGSCSTKNISESIRKIETLFNFKENNILLIDGEKAGCKQYSINTFCLFKSNDNETFLVYSVKNSMERYIRIYALNMDNNEKSILCEEYEDNNNVIKNRRIPTQCKYYNIDREEYIIAGFRDSFIYIWELKNSEFQKIIEIENNVDPINGICLFKNKKNSELNIIFSEYKQSKINIIMNINEDKNKCNIDIKENIYFLDILEKVNKLYIIAGLLNKVISFEFKEKSRNIKYYDNNRNLNRNSYGKGHECVIIYNPNENENDIKIIDSDYEGKCINIFNFESTKLLLILDLINSKPLGINIWNEKYIIVSCLESIDNDSIKIIKINLNKRLYNQKKVDLLKNEDGSEGKIVVNLKGHENGTISTLSMKNERYGEFFVSIGVEQKQSHHGLKLWINDVGASSFENSS